MNLIKKYWSYAALAILAIFLVKECNKPPKVDYKDVLIEVPIPVVEKQFDTVRPKPITKTKKVIDSTYYKKYLSLKDSVQRDSAYRDAIQINEYNQVFKDTFQTIEVYTKSRGEVLEQSLKYKTEPRTITVRDSIPIIPKRTFSLGVEVGVPTVHGLGTSPVIKGGIQYKNRKGNTTSLSYDTEGRIWLGKTFKLF